MHKNGYFLFDREKWMPDLIANHLELMGLWTYLLTHATWQESEIIWKGKPRTIPAGSILFGMGELATCWKVPKRTLSHWIKRLSLPSFSLRTSCAHPALILRESCAQGTLVTICNWTEIQSRKEETCAPIAHLLRTSCADLPPYELSELKELKKEEETNENLFPIPISKKTVPAKKKPSPTDQNGVGIFIGTYVKSFQGRYGDQARPALGGKVQGQIKTLLRDLPIDRACSLIQVYLQMETPWFKTKSYDIGTFIENLNPISLALDTGQEQSGGTNWDKIKKELNIEN
jgi:hypothetical protein